MSQTLQRLREKYPQYAETPDTELIRRVGEKYPQYTERDPEFKAEHAGVMRVWNQKSTDPVDSETQFDSARTHTLAEFVGAANPQPKFGGGEVSQERIENAKELNAMGEVLNARGPAGQLRYKAEAALRDVDVLGAGEWQKNPLLALSDNTKEIFGGRLGGVGMLIKGASEAGILPKGVQQLAAGAQRSVGDVVEFFTTPEGIAMLGIGGLPSAAQKASMAWFFGDMASKLPSQYAEVSDAIKSGDKERIGRAIGTAGTSTLFTAGIGAGAIRGHAELPRTSVAVKEAEAVLMDAGKPEVKGEPIPPKPAEVSAEVPVAPAEPSVTGPGAATPADIAQVAGEMKQRKFIGRFKDTEEIQLETRKAVRNEFQLPRSNPETAAAVNTMIEYDGIEGFARRILTNDPTLAGEEKVVGMFNITSRLNDQAAALDAAGKAEQANYVRDRVIDLVDTVSEQQGTFGGRTVQAFSLWGHMSPEGLVRDYQHKVAKVQEKATKKIQSGLNAITDLVNSKEFQDATTDKQRGMLMDAFGGLGQASKGLRKSIVKLLEAAKSPKIFNEELIKKVYEALNVPTLDKAQLRDLLKKAHEAHKLPEGFQRNSALSDIAAEFRKHLGVRGFEIAKSWWYASILSGPPTQIVNALGGSMKSVTDVAIRNVLHPGSTKQLWAGYVDGLREGWNEMRAIVGEGDYSRRERNLFIPQELELLSDSPSRFKRILSYGKYVVRLMTGVDMVNFKGAEEAFARLEAWKIAKSEKLKGKEMQSRVNEILHQTPEHIKAAEAQAKGEGLTGLDYKRRVDEIIEQARPSKIMDQAREFGLEATYNQDPSGSVGVVVEALDRLKNHEGVIGKAATMVVPFTRIVGNVFNEQINWTPYGYKRLFKMNREGLHGTDAFKAQAFKASVGTFGMAWLYGMIKFNEDENGNSWFDVTGSGPENRDAKNAKRETGWHPNTVQVGDAYISYLNTPFAVPFAIIGSLRDAEKYGKMERKDALERTAFAMMYGARSIFDQSFLTGVSDFVEAINTRADGKAFAGILQRAGSAFVLPNFVKWVDGVFDPTITRGDTLKQRFIRDIPIARSTLGKPMLNALGEPVIREGSARFKMDRFWTLHRDDPVWNLFAEKNVFPSKPQKSTLINNEPIGPEQYYQLTEIRGKMIRATIEENIDMLKGESREEFQDWLEAVSSAMSQAAKTEVTATD